MAGSILVGHPGVPGFRFSPEQIADHYAHGALIVAIEVDIRRVGKTTETISVHDLAGVDEFHVGGRQASDEYEDTLTKMKNIITNIEAGPLSRRAPVELIARKA